MQCMLSREALMKGVTPVSNLFIIEYMPTAPENCVKAYLFGLMRCTCEVSSEDMAGALGLSEAELAEIFAYWQQQGLVNIVLGDPLTVEYLDIGSGTPRATRHYAALISGMQQALGSRMLSGAELTKVYDWIEVFGMQQATAVMLVQHCIKTRGQSVKMSYMDAVAKDWANAGILTPEAAEGYLAEYDEYAAKAQKVLQRWRRARPVTQDELALYRKWLGWGFNEEDILAACAELTGAGQPSFKLLNSALESMRLNGAKDSASLAEYRKKQNSAEETTRLLFQRAGLKKAPAAEQTGQVFCWLYDWHMNVELLMQAAEFSETASYKFNYLAKLVAEWHTAGVKTLEQARAAHEKQTRRETAANSKQSSMKYMQRTYTAEDYKNIGVKLLDDEDDEP